MEKLVNDAGHVFDVAETTGSSERPLGVRHEILQDGTLAVVREVWYWLDSGAEKHVDEVRMPLNDLVHLAVNITPGELHHIADVRTTQPDYDWADVRSPPG